MTKTEEISIWLSMLMTILLKFQYPHHHPRGAGFVWLVSLLFLTHANVLAATCRCLTTSFATLLPFWCNCICACYSSAGALKLHISMVLKQFYNRLRSPKPNWFLAWDLTFGISWKKLDKVDNYSVGIQQEDCSRDWIYIKIPQLLLLISQGSKFTFLPFFL
jgi:hypothetical protein